MATARGRWAQRGLTVLVAALLLAGVWPLPESAQPATAASVPSAASSASAAQTMAQARNNEGPRPSGQRESARRTAESQKHVRIDSNLAQTIRASQSGGRSSGLESARTRGLAVSDQMVRAIVESSSANLPAARAAVGRAGGKVEAEYVNVLQALLPPSGIEAVAANPAVRYVRTPARPNRDGVSGEGVGASGASAWHAAGVTGQGVKVGIIDFGFTDYQARQASNDLPGSATVVDYCNGAVTTAGGEHGTAVAEVVHEMAPAAELYLLCVDTEVQLGLAKEYAKANGLTILVMSASWFNTSRGDGSGGPTSPNAIAADARANGILWVNSAGNRAEQHWSGTFNDSDADGAHNFSPTDNGNTIFLNPGATTCASLKWDSWPTTSQDYDLELTVSSTSVLVASSTNHQTGGQPPTEDLCYTNTTGVGQNFAIWIVKFAATATPQLDLFIYPGPNLEYITAAGSITEPGSSPNVLAVGAVCWQSDRLESYSGQGPTIDGRIKPDIAGQSVVSSGSYGSFASCPSAGNGQGGFNGTSAAAPHVAGAAALVKSANPSFTPEQLQLFLEGRAVDLGTSGKDNQYGSGKLALGSASGGGGAPAPTATPTLGPSPTATPTLTPQPGPGLEAYPQTSQYFPEDDTDKSQSLTDDERRQRRATNRLGSDDVHTEGNVLQVACSDAQPYLVIGMRDGKQTVRLHDNARKTCGSVRVGDYVMADGAKEHEFLFDADELEIAE